MTLLGHGFDSRHLHFSRSALWPRGCRPSRSPWLASPRRAVRIGVYHVHFSHSAFEPRGRCPLSPLIAASPPVVRIGVYHLHTSPAYGGATCGKPIAKCGATVASTKMPTPRQFSDISRKQLPCFSPKRRYKSPPSMARISRYADNAQCCGTPTAAAS